MTELAWHFHNGKLRDGRGVPAVGETLVHEGPVVICESGLHASKELLDALKYAPGNILTRVQVNDIVYQYADKLVCRERTILWSIDATEILREFTRKCALDVIHLWDAPEVVKKYLETGDELLQEEAYAAADATRVASYAADATRASSFASYAADAADAAAYATRAASYAASYAAYTAADTASYAAAYVARATICNKQNALLEDMVRAEK